MNSGLPITGDWAVDRLIRCKIRLVPGTFIPPFNIAANHCRVGMQIIEQDIPAEMTFGVVKGGVVFPMFQVVDMFRWPMWTLLEHGELPTLAWQVIANPNGNVLNIVEYILPEDVLTLNPQLLERAR